MNLDKGTFGNSKACEKLARVISEADNKHALRRVAALLTELNQCFAELARMQNVKVRRHLSSMARNHAINVAKNFDFPDEIKSLTDNVITYYWRMFCVYTKANVPYKEITKGKK